MADIILMLFFIFNNDVIIVRHVIKKIFKLLTNIARFAFSVSYFKFETPIVVSGLIILNRG